MPVTGRPAGWCELIARLWPVAGVVGENGAFYFRYHHKKMERHFALDEKTRTDNQTKLMSIREEILLNVPGSALASDQFCRLFDLAIDFCEDVPPLPDSDVKKIVSIFQKHGATAKVSSIHVNGWFGHYDKLSMCKEFCSRALGFDLESRKNECAFIGDSPNDEPMFAYFEKSFAVSNVRPFLNQIQAKPKYITPSPGGRGFVELTDLLLLNLG